MSEETKTVEERADSPFGDPLLDMTEAELDTAVEVMRENEVLAWADSVDWSRIDDDTKTLIIGNVRGFANSPMHLTNQFITKLAATINANASALTAERERREAAEEPIPMILHCPCCKTQHVDKATPYVCESCGHPQSEHWSESEDEKAGCYQCGGFVKGACEGFVAWLNPPHRKHRCEKCNLVFQPALVRTVGVEALKESK